MKRILLVVALIALAQAAGGQEGDRPRMIEVLRYGLHRDVAGGGMENLRAGGWAADRNDPDRARRR